MAERKVLHSWKDIANYTGRGVRTIQRYEVQLGFPIHRPSGKSRSAVLAFSDEIDAWLSRAPQLQIDSRNAGAARKLREAEKRSRHEIETTAIKGQRMATTIYESSTRQAERVEAMVQKLRKYQKPRNCKVA